MSFIFSETSCKIYRLSFTFAWRELHIASDIFINLACRDRQEAKPQLVTAANWGGGGRKQAPHLPRQGDPQGCPRSCSHGCCGQAGGMQRAGKVRANGANLWVCSAGCGYSHCPSFINLLRISQVQILITSHCSVQNPYNYLFTGFLNVLLRS